MHYNITGTFRVGPTILDHDKDEVTLRRHANNDSQRDKIVDAMNTLNAVSLVVNWQAMWERMRVDES